jgi:hypothetical protein
MERLSYPLDSLQFFSHLSRHHRLTIIRQRKTLPQIKTTMRQLTDADGWNISVADRLALLTDAHPTLWLFWERFFSSVGKPMLHRL